MKNIVIGTIFGLLLFNSCTVTPPPYVQTEYGFEVNAETASTIISSKILHKDVTYEDELSKLCDGLSNVTALELVTEDDLRFIAEVSLDGVSDKRKKEILGEFDALFSYYGNVVSKCECSVEESNIIIQSMADGISKVLEVYWVTSSDELF